jgi:uncharacterized peroxidase-related enzyme
MVTNDEALVAAVRRDWRQAPIEPREREMLAYVEKLTLEPASVGRGDVDRLRSAGFDDLAVLQIALIASFFNYFNRMADGLGVGRP